MCKVELLGFTGPLVCTRYGEEPDYAAYVALFEPLATAGPGTMPLTLAPPSLRVELVYSCCHL